MIINSLTHQEQRDYLSSMVPQQEQEVFRSLKHSYLEGAFIGRIFIVFKAAGMTGGVPNPPKILGRVKVHDFESDAEFGSDFSIEDMETRERLWIGHTPKRLFGYNIFMAVPTRLQLGWASNRDDEGNVRHTMVFGVLIRVHSRSEYCTEGKQYCLTPKRFKELYPDIEIDLR